MQIQKLIILVLFGSILSCSHAPKKTKALPEACSQKCKTPYGQKLGTGATDLEAYSNCQSSCVIFTPHEQQGVYTGIKWQCVEYARRWLIKNKSLTYGSVDFASDIWGTIKNYDHIKTENKVPVKNILNGAKTPPKVGDLLIYGKEFKGTGHVAVIAQVNLKKGWLRVEEENFNNTQWPGNYARQLNFVIKNGQYWVLDPYLIGWKSL